MKFEERERKKKKEEERARYLYGPVKENKGRFNSGRFYEKMGPLRKIGPVLMENRADFR